MTVGQRIRQGRERAGWTQEDLAEAMGVSRQAVSKWEADRARPTAEKLERLSEALDIPPEAWTVPEEETAPGPPEHARPWKLATAALSAALCAVLARAVLWPREAERTEADGQVPEEARPADTSYMFPETLPLQAEPVEDFGDVPLPAGDPADAAAIPARDSEDTLFCEEFPGGAWLTVYRTNPTPEYGFTYYDVYAARSSAATGGAWVSLGRLTEWNHYASDGLYGAEYVENVLGRDCWKVSLGCGAACVMAWYFTEDPDTGAVRLLLEAGTPCYQAETDLDGDGVREVAAWGGALVTYTIYDLQPDGACTAYTLDAGGYGAVPIGFSPEEGFTVTGSAGDILVRYRLEGDCLRRQPQTDFSPADYPDVADTEVRFLLDGELSDGVDPDTVLDSGVARATRRQQAYLALQALYDLTGFRLETVWCMAGRDQLSFCVDDAGDGTGCFYTVTPGKRYGGTSFATGCRIVWQEEEAWSPLRYADARHPLYCDEPDPCKWLLAACRGDLDFFCGGEVLTAAPDPEAHYGETRYVAYREDGSFYSAELLPTDLGYALKRFCGPCPPPWTTEE